MFTSITFAPVQGFIEKSRKLRDLYGSSFILSYLAKGICEDGMKAGCKVTSPALLNVAQGTPNQIILQGNYPYKQAREDFFRRWKQICTVCREWIEDHLPEYRYTWKRDWDLWGNHAWEFFWAEGESIGEARRNIARRKQERDWVGVNWEGESSTLSGADAIAWYGMGENTAPHHRDWGEVSRSIKDFYTQMSRTPLGEAFMEGEGREQLSIPELIKRMVTYQPIAQRLGIEKPDVPPSFADLSRWKENIWTAWFQGDGDNIGNYLMRLPAEEEAKNLHDFSQAMMHWGKDYLRPSLPEEQGRIIYAGGDDFLGVILDKQAKHSTDIGRICLEWFYRFPDLWKKHQRPITVSVGLVVAAGGVPQRDVLQHCKETEQMAKSKGKDRLAIRILFNGGNYLQWHCPWDLLQEVLTGYSDRQGGKNWGHIYGDVAVLEQRHAFDSKDNQIAKALLSIYWGERIAERAVAKISEQELTDWTINLAKVGWHLCSST